MDGPSLSAKGGCPGAHRKRSQLPGQLPGLGPDYSPYKRRRDTSEEPVEDQGKMPFGFKRRKRSAAEKPATQDTAEGSSVIPAVPAGSSSSLDSPTEEAYGNVSQLKSIHRSKSLDDGQPAAPSSLSDMLARSEAKIARLEADLLESRQYGTQVELRVKQDMLLDIFKERQEKQHMAYQLAREKRHVSKLSDHFIEKTKRLEAEKLLERNKFLNAQQDANNLRADVEHYQTLTGMLETDIDELRQIENAAAEKKKEEMRGLPPAYGSLHDEDRFPPYNQHTDGGTLEIASIKREVRNQFQRKAEAAQAAAAAVSRNSVIEQAYGGSAIFCILSQALVEACERLQVLLGRAAQVLVTRHYPPETAAGGSASSSAVTQRASNAPLVADRLRRAAQVLVTRHHPSQNATAGSASSSVVTQRAGNAPFVADRLAKLIIDLCWRLLSTMEARPSTLTLTTSQKTHLALQHARIDETLLVVLQASFSERRTLWDLQYYLTQLISLRAQFLGVRSGISYMFFHKCAAWLADQVEKERELAANRTEARPGQEDPPDDISSHWPGSPRSEDAHDQDGVLF